MPLNVLSFLNGPNVQVRFTTTPVSDGDGLEED